MNNSKTFYIAALETKDTESLHNLMTSNLEHFSLYLPKTLEQNSTLKASAKYIQKKAFENNQKETLTYAIKSKETNEVAGLIIIKKIDLPKKQGELAYGIGKAFEGRGWVTQAVRFMSDYAFKQFNLKTLQIITHKTNIGSSKVAEKSGFVWKCTLKNEFSPTNGTPLDMELYELTL